MSSEDWLREWLQQTIDSPSFQVVLKESLQFQKDLRKKHNAPEATSNKEISRLVNIVLLLDEKIQQQNQQIKTLQTQIDALEKEVILTRIEVAQTKIATHEQQSKG